MSRSFYRLKNHSLALETQQEHDISLGSSTRIFCNIYRQNKLTRNAEGQTTNKSFNEAPSLALLDPSPEFVDHSSRNATTEADDRWPWYWLPRQNPAGSPKLIASTTHPRNRISLFGEQRGRPSFRTRDTTVVLAKHNTCKLLYCNCISVPTTTVTCTRFHRVVAEGTTRRLF